MPRTLGYHFVKSCYGQWLPGDDRGHRSEAWDEEIGFIEPHTLHEGDPVRLRMAQERMLYPPFKLNEQSTQIVVDTIGECVAKSSPRISIVAAAVDFTHMHFLIASYPRNIDNTIKWMLDQTTKAIHRQAHITQPIWVKGRWLEYIEDLGHWENIHAYIERHNEKNGRPIRPYPWVDG